MKKQYFTILLIAFFVSVSASFAMAGGGNTKATFGVSGKCDMCERTIETAAMKLKGVSVAMWDLEAQELTVKYKEDKISLDEIKAALAGIGYDTDTHKATDEAYDNLHHCCKYQRVSEE